MTEQPQFKDKGDIIDNLLIGLMACAVGAFMALPVAHAETAQTGTAEKSAQADQAVTVKSV